MAETGEKLVVSRRRPWYWLHRSTVLLLIAGIFVAAVVELPGDDAPKGMVVPSGQNACGFTIEAGQVDHGWPFVYLKRHTLGLSPTGSISFAAIWNVTNGVESISMGAAALDALIISMVLVAIVIFHERKRRRGDRLTQFRLRTFMIATAVCAGFFAWWRQERLLDTELRTHLDAIDPSGMDRSWRSGGVLLGKTTPISRLPLWLNSLIGEDRAADIGVTQPGFAFISWSPRIHDDVKYLVDRFPSRIVLVLERDCSDDGWLRLSKLETLRTMCVIDPTIGRSGVEAIKQLRSLEDLTLVLLDVPDGLQEELQKALPHCKVHLAQTPLRE